MCVGTHGSSQWSSEGNGTYFSSLVEVEMSYLEKESVRLADAIVSPTQYMIDWMEARNWALPKSTMTPLPSSVTIRLVHRKSK